MTRPKVPPDQRQRTAQACESCKRRKQKCNGLCPCNTCDKRKFTCVYTDRDPTSPIEDRPPTKKRAIEAGGEGNSPFINDDSTSNTPSNGHNHPSPVAPQRRRSSAAQRPKMGARPLSVKQETPFKSPVARPTIELGANSEHQLPRSHNNGVIHPDSSRGATVQSGQEDEAEFYSQSRMLQDPTGRVLYIGDSATLSFLQLLRMMVETVAGSSPFTTDPRRHKIVEGQYSLPPGYRHTHLLPDEQTARVLVEAFFINTHGILQVFERDRFYEHLESCYSDPLTVEPSWLCLLNLVFAIGLTMATPLSGSPEALIIDKLRSEHLDRAEVFYLNAKSLNDPMTGLEDQDFWAVQALLLTSFFMLAKCKRNNAFATLGMAARAGVALGLHREETMVIFSPEEQMQRKNLWRSIFVIDRLLSCLLGRPTAISEDDCSGDTLRPQEHPREWPFHSNTHVSNDYLETGPPALEAAVRSCSTIGTILRKVYQKRKINSRLAQEIADVCRSWPEALHPILRWGQAATASPSQGVAILHVNLLYCHSIILLSRPFFLFILNRETQRIVNQPGLRGPRPVHRADKFSIACVVASTHTILLVNNAFEAGYLSRRNPAVIYFLFSAALVILANGFAGLHKDDAFEDCIAKSISIMSYCAESDQQASRLVYILSSFRDVVARQRMRRRQSQMDASALPSIASQLYGVNMPHPQHQPLNPNAGGPVHPVNTLDTTPRLHQVPVHIYPGMQTAPLNDPPQPPLTYQASDPHNQLQQPPPHPHQRSAHATDPEFSVHLSPIQDGPLDISNPQSTFHSHAHSTFSSPARPSSLSAMLDLSALEATRVPSLHSEESGQDEQIDFDALWAWPSNTPAVGTPREVGNGEAGAGKGGWERVQGISDSAVPMFGVSREGTDCA